MITYRCNYYRLLAGMASLATGVWPGETEQCPTAPTHYVSVKRQLDEDTRVEHLVNLCASHEEMVRALPGWSGSVPKEVYA